jgi:hypothetical protein
MRTRTLSLLGLVMLSSLAACAAEGDDASEGTGSAFSGLTPYWADAKKLNLDDLTRASVGFATQGINDALSSGSSGLRFDPPQVFAAQAQPNKVLPSSVEVKGLDGVVSGLAARFGEQELGTEVNKARLQHLQSSADKYYVESAFTARAGLDHQWTFDAEGFGDVGVQLGIDAGVQLASRVVLAAPDEKIDSLVQAPLQAAKAMRGFVYPRTVEDVRNMKPGEMFALRGLGKLGANFGVGAPLLVAEPTGGLAYQILVSAGVSGVIGGQVDVQLLRLGGDEVVVDVGVENGRGVSFQAAIKDGFGIKAVCEDGKSCLRKVELAGHSVDLAKLVQKAVEKRLNGYLAVKLEGQAASASSRVSLSRFRFHLDQGNPDEVEKALQRALKFDIRLAQALYNRDLDQRAPAVVAEFDAVRASTTSTRSFGFGLFGIDVYHRAVVQNQGSFTVQTPDGAKSILFDSIHKQGGWFQKDHQYTRTGLAAQTVDARDPDAFRSEANLFVQTAVGDTVRDDFLLDNADALLLGIAGPKVVEALDQYGSQMERLTDACVTRGVEQPGSSIRRNVLDPACASRLVASAQMAQLKAQGLAAVEPLIAGLPADFQEVTRQAAKLRLSLQSIPIGPHAGLASPSSAFTLDARFDDKALDALTDDPKAKRGAYEAALREYLVAIYAKRHDLGSATTKDAVRADMDRKHGSDIKKMGATFQAKAQAYRDIVDAERFIPRALAGKRFVSYPLGLRFSVERDEARTIESAAIQSTSHDRALAAAALFDGLRDTSDDEMSAPLYDEQTATFPLLQLVPQEALEIGMTVTVEDLSRAPLFQQAGFGPVLAAAKGEAVSTISAGMFDINKVVSGQ